MSVRVTGTIYVDVEDYQDDIEIHADVDDIYDLMMENGISSEDMIDFLKDGESSASQDDVIKYIDEVADHDDLSQIHAALFCRMRDDYKTLSADRSRIQNEMATERANAQSTKTAAIQAIKVINEELGSPVTDKLKARAEADRLYSMFN